MQELTELPAATLDTKFKPFFVAPDTNFGICVHLALHAITDEGCIFCDGLFNVNTDTPVKIGCTVPLPHFCFFIQLAQMWTSK